MNVTPSRVSEEKMRKLRVVVPWKQGLHMRAASKLVRHANACQSSIRLKAHGNVADARSILAILLLCAVVGTILDVEVSGADEASVATAVERIFDSGDSGDGGDVEFQAGGANYLP